MMIKFTQIALGVSLLLPVAARGAITYVDATPANTTLADGTALTLLPSVVSADPPQDYTSSSSSASANNHWHYRTGFANGSAIWEAPTGAGTAFANNAPELKTVVTGLSPGAVYDVFVYYWVGGITASDGSDVVASGNQEWDISAGLSPGSLTTVRWNTGTQINANPSHPGFSGTVLKWESSDRALYEYKVGVAIADGTGAIAVYIDDLPGNDDRTWYDGVGTRPSGVWDGEGTDALWSTAANWFGDVPPASGSTLTFTGNTNTSPENDLAADSSFAGLVFNPGAGAFLLAGNRITLAGNLTNASTSGQTIAMPLLFSGDRKISCTGGVYIEGAISGASKLTKTGSGLLDLSGANDYSGGLTVLGGNVNLVNDQSAANGALIVGPDSSATVGVSIVSGAVAATAAGTVSQLGTLTGSGSTTPQIATYGTMNCAGEIKLGRVALLTVYDGGVWNQSGPVSINGVGGYSSDLRVNGGGTFNYTGASNFLLQGTAGNSGQARITVADTGVFTTLRGFEETTASAAGYGRVSLINGGTLKLAGDVAALTTEVQFELGTGGGVIDTNGFSGTLSGIVTVLTSPTAGILGAGSLTKKGAGTLTLTGTNSYTGDTSVAAGTLSLAHDSLADGANVKIASGATLDLTHGNTDVVSQLYIDGVHQASGIWGAVGSGAPHESAQITGTGRLDVTVGPGFAAWAADHSLSGTPNADADADGLPDAVEYLLGTNPKAASSGAITHQVSGGSLVVTFPRVDTSETADVSLVVQAGTDLVAWPDVFTVGADTASSSSGVTVSENSGEADTITVTIPTGGAPRLFARLKVTVKP